MEKKYDVVVSGADLENYCSAVLRYVGVDAGVAAEVAHHLVEANLFGHDSHGVGMLPQYCSNLARGRCRGNGTIKVIQQKGATLVMDAEKLFGQTALRQAVERAALVAKQHGVCALTLRQVHHIGRTGAYAEQAASLGLASIFFGNINDHAPLVAPYGGSEPRGSTNPISLGVPRPGSNVVLDFATSTWPLGKARVAFNRFEQLPEGVAIDSQGLPARDPAVLFPGVARGGAYTLGMKDAAKMGCLTAFGAHKGAGLNLFCELFAALAGGGTSAAKSPSNPVEGRANGTVNNVFCLLVDPTALAAECWSEEVETMLDWWKDCPAAPGMDVVLIPGEAESKSAAVRRVEGIRLEATTWNALLGLADGTITPPAVALHRPQPRLAQQRTVWHSHVVAAGFAAAAVFAAGFVVGRRIR